MPNITVQTTWRRARRAMPRSVTNCEDSFLSRCGHTWQVNVTVLDSPQGKQQKRFKEKPGAELLRVWLGIGLNASNGYCQRLKIINGYVNYSTVTATNFSGASTKTSGANTKTSGANTKTSGGHSALPPMCLIQMCGHSQLSRHTEASIPVRNRWQ